MNPAYGDSCELAGMNFRVISVIDSRVRLRVTHAHGEAAGVRRVAGELSVPLASYWGLDTAAQREGDADR